MPRNKSKESQKALTFEQALERIEAIVRRMEEGTMGLDEMMARFEEGRALITFCRERLNEVEKKVERLLEKDGELMTEPLDPTVPEAAGDEEPGDTAGS
jgi:exodeoxyribonuclease VII small subunit